MDYIPFYEKLHFLPRVNCSIILYLFPCFIGKQVKQGKNNECYDNIVFFSIKFDKYVFFNAFRSISSILDKIPFSRIIYAISKKKKIQPKKWLFQCFSEYFLSWWKKSKKIFLTTIYIFFSKNCIELPFINFLNLSFTLIYIYYKSA